MFGSCGERIVNRFDGIFRILVMPVFMLLHACAGGTQASVSAAGIEVILNPIQVIDGSGSAYVSPGGQAQMLGYVSAVAASGGYVFVVDSTVSGLVRIDPVSGEMTYLWRLQDPTTRGLFVRPDLIVYVVDRQNRAIIELDDSGHERHVFHDPGAMAMPVDVVMTDWGSSLVVADEMTQRLVTFESFSTLTGVLPNSLAPISVAGSIAAIAGTERYVFVLDSASREVMQMDLAGRLVATYGEDALLAPVAMAVDECERVFVADGHPDGLFVTSPDTYGSDFRAAMPRELLGNVTDLWIDGNELYVAAGVFGVWVMSIEPGCYAQ
jgi:DNA-binding beta-propeller fold protein YncE